MHSVLAQFHGGNQSPSATDCVAKQSLLPKSSNQVPRPPPKPGEEAGL